MEDATPCRTLVRTQVTPMNPSLKPLAALLLAALAPAVTAHALTISGDAFTATMADDTLGPIELEGSTSPFPGTAGLPGIDLASDRLEIDWLSEDTFTVRVKLASDLSNLKIIIDDLSFKEGLNPVNIAGVVFDDAATPQETYMGYEAISGPSVSSSAHAIEVGFSNFPAGVAADGIPWYFKVRTARGTSTSVPDHLPTSVTWLAFGGLALAFHRRRQER